MLIVDASLSERDAWHLAQYYNSLYEDRTTLTIEMMCDDEYATMASFTNTPVMKFYLFVLYEYERIDPGLPSWATPTDPRWDGQASKCT